MVAAGRVAGPGIGWRLNGATVIAVIGHAVRSDEAMLVVEFRGADGQVFEYATGRVGASEPEPREWHAGYYVPVAGRSVLAARGAAMRDALTRAGYGDVLPEPEPEPEPVGGDR